MSRRVLLLLAHPVLERSKVNRRLLEGARGLEGVTVHDLYEAYPAMQLSVRREQQLLLEHDVIVFQHPFYWYSTPAILKEWQDLVLEHNWAYGEKGHHLDGKITLNVVSTGGSEQAYGDQGFNRFSVRQLLAPYELTANLCRMKFLPPFVVHSAFQVESDAQFAPVVTEYRQLLEALRDDKVDVEAAARLTRMNSAVDTVLTAGGQKGAP